MRGSGPVCAGCASAGHWSGGRTAVDALGVHALMFCDAGVGVVRHASAPVSTGAMPMARVRARCRRRRRLPSRTARRRAERQSRARLR